MKNLLHELIFLFLIRYFNCLVNIAEFLESYGNQVPTLVGIKYSSTDLSEVVQVMETRSNVKKFTIFLGAEKVKI